MLQAGRVRVNGKLVKRATDLVGPSDDVRVDDAPPAAPPPAPSASPRLPILYEDADLLVVDKPPGLLTSTVPRERRPTLLALVRQHVAQSEPAARVGLIHRLDRDASGLLVFSKHHDAYRSLKQQFFDHSVERLYTAVVHGIPTPRAGRVESRLLERADGTVYSTKNPGEGDKALTEYEVVEEHGGRSVLRVKLHTGRKHQIRVHLSQRATPIVGDRVYGREGDESPHLLLAATTLSFTHPRTGERKTFQLPRPKWSILLPPAVPAAPEPCPTP
jgi:23S rRNA pseudouridine1911/1915/1917 synthase